MKKSNIERDNIKGQIMLEAIINNFPDIIYQLDPDGKIIYINDNINKYNYQPEDLIGKSIFDIVHPGDKERAQWHVNERRTGERRTRSFEVQLLAADNKDTSADSDKKGRHKNPIFVLHAEGIYDKSNPAGNTFLGTQAIARDISEKKMIEEQLRQAQKMEAIGLLAGGIAHDFNNMLTVVLGYADVLLMEMTEDSPFYKKLKHIRNAGESAKSLTGQLLSYSRRQILKPEILDLNSIILHMEPMIQRMIKENIELTIELQKDLDFIKTDPTQMEQIIMNLTGNANDAMPDGGKLEIKTENIVLDSDFTSKNVGSTEGFFVKLSVSDTGVGLDDDLKENIFDPFFTTKEIGKGTGLGLATVYGIIKQSNGNIWVNSSPGQGTRFDIFLPRSDEKPQAKEEQHDFTKTRKTTGTIMVVEDEKEILEFISQLLKEKGYNVLEAADGKKALKQFHAYDKPVHLLLTDVIMPNMNGPQLAQKLAAENPGLKILFMSGYTDNIIAQMGVLDIDKEFIKKPFLPLELLNKISEMLDN
jgi:two-component system, cell cycle sensor histidine kinase and response regulator CckA